MWCLPETSAVLRMGSEQSTLKNAVCITYFEQESAVGSLACLALAFHTGTTVVTSNHVYMQSFTVILIASCHPILASGCMLSVSCVCIVSLGPCLPKLLAWHVEAVFVKVMAVQVCSESAGHAEAAQMTHVPQQVI